MKVGDKVMKNAANWKPNEFDSWGRGVGVGVGVIVKPPFELEPGEYDVKWPKGRCFESSDQIIPERV